MLGRVSAIEGALVLVYGACGPEKELPKRLGVSVAAAMVVDYRQSRMQLQAMCSIVIFALWFWWDIAGVDVGCEGSASSKQSGSRRAEPVAPPAKSRFSFACEPWSTHASSSSPPIVDGTPWIAPFLKTSLA